MASTPPSSEAQSPKPEPNATKSALLAFLRSNPELTQHLTDPSVQQYLTSALTSELAFQKRQEQYHQSRSHSANSSSRFPNPNSQPLSPLEQKLLEGVDSKEQQTLRVLLKQLLE